MSDEVTVGEPGAGARGFLFGFLLLPPPPTFWLACEWLLLPPWPFCPISALSAEAPLSPVQEWGRLGGLGTMVARTHTEASQSPFPDGAAHGSCLPAPEFLVSHMR